MSLRTMFKIVRIAIFSFAGIAHGGDLLANGTASAEPLSLARASFQTYIAASPSIWWDNRSVLSDENSFSQRIKTIKLRLRVLITSAGNEQYFGPDPKLREEDKGGMIDSASDLANRLTTYNPQNLSVTYAIFPGEDHDSASLASLGRALYFALKP